MRQPHFSRQMRRNQTPQEKIMWNALRNRNLSGLKFRRQVVIGHFIVDFMCKQYRLILEIDGEIHAIKKEYDAHREEYLQNMHYTVIRFTNDQVEQDLQAVLKFITQIVSRIPPLLTWENEED